MGGSGQSALRKWRISSPESVYAVTKCILDPRFPLIANPLNLEQEGEVPGVVLGCIRWLHEARRVRCHGCVVMPDHVHLTISVEEGQGLSKVMSSFGKYTALRINYLYERQGKFWQPGFYDHRIRDERALMRQLTYIYENPLKKGYVKTGEDWPFSYIMPDW